MSREGPATKTFGYRPVSILVASILEDLDRRGVSTAIEVATETVGSRDLATAHLHRMLAAGLVEQVTVGTWRISRDGRRALAAHKAALKAWARRAL